MNGSDIVQKCPVLQNGVFCSNLDTKIYMVLKIFTKGENSHWTKMFFYPNLRRFILFLWNLAECVGSTVIQSSQFAPPPPPLPFCMEGGSWASNQIFKKWRLDRTSTFRGGLLTKKVYEQKYFSLLQLRIQTLPKNLVTIKR